MSINISCPFRIRWTLVIVLLVASKAWAQGFEVPSIGETIGSQVGSALAAVSQHKANKAQLTAQIRQARSDYFRLFPDKPGMDEASARFGELLRIKDFYYLELRLAGAAADPFGQYGALGRLLQLEQLSGGELDGGIPEAAESAFSGWIAEITWQFGGDIRGASKAQLISAIKQAEPEYEKYRKARDRAEFQRAGISPQLLESLHAQQEKKRRQKEERRRAEKAAADARQKARALHTERCEALDGEMNVIECKLTGCTEPGAVMFKGECRSLRSKAAELRLQKQRQAEKARRRKEFETAAKIAFERDLEDAIPRLCEINQLEVGECQVQGKTWLANCRAQHTAEKHSTSGESPYVIGSALHGRLNNCLADHALRQARENENYQLVDQAITNDIPLQCAARLRPLFGIDTTSKTYNRAKKSCIDTTSAKLSECMAQPSEDFFSRLEQCSESARSTALSTDAIVDVRVLRPYCESEAWEQATHRREAPFDQLAALTECVEGPADEVLACNAAVNARHQEHLKRRYQRPDRNEVRAAAERCVERLQGAKQACIKEHPASGDAADEKYMSKIQQCIAAS